MAGNWKFPVFAVVLAAGTGFLLAVVLLPLLGAAYTPQQTVNVWSVIFASITLPGAFSGITTSHARLRGLVLLVLALAGLFAVRTYALPVAAEFGIVPEPVLIIPVTS